MDARALIDFALLSFISLFAMVDPLGVIPTFVALTANNNLKERLKTAGVASLTGFGILILFMFAGQWLLRSFSVTLPAFQIFGGIVLFIVAVDMVQAKSTSIKVTQEETEEGIQKEDPAITPLAMPLLAGPGAMTTAVLLSSRAANASQYFILAADIFLVFLITFLILRFVAIHSARLQIALLKIITRLMGILLGAVAVQFVINGIKQSL